MNYQEYLNSEHWKNIKKETYKKQDICVLCKSKDNLNIHHKSYKAKGVNVLYKEHKFKDLLIVLCKECHEEWHKYDEKWYAQITKKRMKQITKLLSLGDSKSNAFKLYSDKEYEKRLHYLKTVHARFKNTKKSCYR